MRWQEEAPNGSRKFRRKSFGTKKEADQFRAKTVHEMATGAYVAPTDQTVGQFLERWLEAISGSVKPSTQYGYASVIRNHLTPALGSLPLANLTPPMVQACYRRFAESGTAPSTVALRHTILSKALEQAVRWRLVSHNVAKLVNPPVAGKREVQTGSPEDARAFLVATEHDERAPLWRSATFDAGMRLENSSHFDGPILTLSGEGYRSADH